MELKENIKDFDQIFLTLINNIPNISKLSMDVTIEFHTVVLQSLSQCSSKEWEEYTQHKIWWSN